jgi:hypothetical protein
MVKKHGATFILLIALLIGPQAFSSASGGSSGSTSGGGFSSSSGGSARMAATSQRSGWSVLYALGNNLKMNGSIRIGYNQWEFGQLNPWAYGAAKSYYFSKSYYTSLGLALMPTISGASAGFVASLGANWELFWSIYLRLEISENANFNANIYEQGILGLGYAF